MPDKVFLLTFPYQFAHFLYEISLFCVFYQIIDAILSEEIPKY